jgi:peptide/nickel transport system substrate-binding protein
MTSTLIKLFLAMLMACPMACSTPESPAPGPVAELKIGTGRDATQPGDYQPFGMWEPGCLIYETLVNLDENSRPLPCLAKAWEISPDGLTYTFHLEEKILFHDKTPFDAQAVKRNFEGIGRAKWQNLGRIIKTVRVEDEHVVSFILNRPSTLFLLHLATSGHGMVSPSALVPKSPDKKNGTMMASMSASPVPSSGAKMKRPNTLAIGHPVGTGPYVWDENAYHRARSFSVTRNNAYWRSKPVFDRITWQVIPDANARTVALETGEIDMTGLTPNGALSRENLDILAKNPNIAFARDANWGTRLMVINHHRPPFDRPRVRQAMKKAIDLSAIQGLLGDTAAVCPGPFAPQTVYAHPGLTLADHDPGVAKTLLDQEGLVDTNKDGWREFEGKNIRLDLVTSKNRGLGILICENLKTVGIDARLCAKESGSVFEVLKQGDYDIISHPNIPSFYLDLYGSFHSKSWLSLHLDDPELDRLLETYQLSTSEERFKTLGFEIQKRVADKDVILFAINEIKVAAYNKGLGTFVYPPEEWVGAAQEIWRMK